MRRRYSVQYLDKNYEVEFNEPSGELLTIQRLDIQNRQTGPTELKRTLMSNLWTTAEIRKALSKAEVENVRQLAIEMRKAQKNKG